VRGLVPRRAAGATIGLLADRLLGEPPPLVHPVAAFGSAMQRLEGVRYADTRAAGVEYSLAGVAIGAVSGALLRAPAVAVALSAAGRELRATAARAHDALLRDDLDAARAIVPALVGRDPTELDASGLAASVIESLGENTVDAVVAPALWAVAAGAAGAATYRALNTMDAMVGHRSDRYRRFGWASARLDDAANFVPARVTAALVALVRPRAAHLIVRAVREQAPAHPSPNAGVAEAAFAAALGVELGGTLRYGSRVEHRPLLGFGDRPRVADIDRAIALASHVELALAGTLGAVAVAGMRTRRRTP
jgi:adenosylcobinamide-phosphate synthase